MAVSHSAQAVGTWQKIPPNPGTGAGSQGFWLLTDGSILSTAENTWSWARLVPDATGSYVKGKWTSVPRSSYGRGAAQQYVLKDGRFFIGGGEYLYQWPNCGSNCYASVSCSNKNFGTAEIYDPVTNKWTVATSAPNIIGDTGSALLSDGRILGASYCSRTVQIYDPATDSWTTGGNTKFDNPENSWANLLNGGVLGVGSNTNESAVYDPASKVWTSTGPWPSGAKFVGCCGGVPDSSGIVNLFDGRVMAFTNPNVMIFTPGAKPTDGGTWASGPAMLNSDTAGDEFAATEPNGKILVTTNPFDKGPDMIQEYDPATNKFTDTKIPNVGCGCSYMNLPNGQVLVTGGDGNYVYTPDSEPQDAWRPTVSSVTYDSGSDTYTLTGTQLSGLVNGADEGDDMKLTANYPIVWLKDTSGNVTFARSFNFSTMVPQQGSAPQTCNFKLPSSLAKGSYSLYVSSVGVKSKDAFTFTVGSGGTSTGSGGAGSGGGSSSGGASVGGSTSGGTTSGGASAGGRANAGGSSAGGSTAGGSTSGGSSTGGANSSGGNGTTVAGASSGGAITTSTGGNTNTGSGGTTTTGSGGTTATGGSSAGAMGAGGSVALGGKSSASGGSSTGGSGSGESSGCGCHIEQSSTQSPGAAGALLGLVGLLMRRRRRQGSQSS